VSSSQSARAGSFKYRNKTDHTQQIDSLTLTVTDPAEFAALTVSVKGTSQSATVSPVGPTTVFPLSPPVTVEVGGTVEFTLSAQTAGGMAAIVSRIADASMLSVNGRSPIVAFSGAIVLLSAFLTPLGIRRQRLAPRLIALVLIALILTMAGCEGGGGFVPTGIQRAVASDGSLSGPVKLSTIKVGSGAAGESSIQTLTALTFVVSSRNIRGQ
jgi:hypothetical protein